MPSTFEFIRDPPLRCRFSMMIEGFDTAIAAGFLSENRFHPTRESRFHPNANRARQRPDSFREHSGQVARPVGPLHRLNGIDLLLKFS